jgi:hypothetical protein
MSYFNPETSNAVSKLAHMEKIKGETQIKLHPNNINGGGGMVLPEQNVKHLLSF